MNDDLEICRAARAQRWGERFMVEGRLNVEALLEGDRFELESVLVEEGRHEDLVSRLPSSPRFHRVKREALEALTGYPFHRGILACARRPAPAPLAGAGFGGTLLVCAGLADESNLGAIIRSAAAFGVSAVAVPFRHGADPFAPKSIRASSGAVFRIPVIQSPQLEADLRGLAEEGVAILGTGLSEEACDLREIKAESSQVLVFGPEKDGLSPEWLELCHEVIRLPMRGGMDSINVSCCAAVVLWEMTAKSRS